MRSRAQLLTRQAERVASTGILQGGAEAEGTPLRWVGGPPGACGGQPGAARSVHCRCIPGKVQQRGPARARGQGQPAVQRGRLVLRRLCIC